LKSRNRGILINNMVRFQIWRHFLRTLFFFPRLISVPSIHSWVIRLVKVKKIIELKPNRPYIVCSIGLELKRFFSFLLIPEGFSTSYLQGYMVTWVNVNVLVVLLMMSNNYTCVKGETRHKAPTKWGLGRVGVCR